LETGLAHSYVTKTILTPCLTPRILNDPIILSLFILIPTNQFKCMALLESRISLNYLIDSLLIDEEILIDGDYCNDRTILIDLAFNSLLSR